MNNPSSPTPYPDVNEVLHNFQAQIQTILGSHFRGMYVYGSLALGDFDPQNSDIDFIVVTDTEIRDDLFNALNDMHVQFIKSNSPWAAKIEAAYIPQEVLQHRAPTSARYPQIEKQKALVREPLEIGWAFQRFTLREHGLVVTGPDLRTLIDPVDPNDMRQAVSTVVGMWQQQAAHDQKWLEWVRGREAQAFVVLTLCRCLYFLDNGTLASKIAAANWAQKALPERWKELIQRSLASQHDESESTTSDVEDTLTLLQYTVDHHE